MSTIKNYAGFLVSLLIGLIILMVCLNLLKKAPVVGGLAQDAQNLATEGTL